MDNNLRPSLPQLACESCRRRKSKCDKKQPRCGTCARLAQQCVFPVERLKPGPKDGPGRSQRLPSTDVDWLSEQAENLDELFGAETSRNHLTSNQPLPPLDDFEMRTPQYFLPLPGQLETAGDYWETTTAYMGSPASWSPQIFYPLASHESSNCRAAGLSALVHPVHENLRTLQVGRMETVSLRTPNFDRLLHQISIEMKISSATLLHLIDVYLSHVMVLSLFHKPSFKDKLNSIQQPLHLKALLASVCSYAARIEQQRWPPGHSASRWHEYHGTSELGDKEPPEPPDPQKLHSLAIRLFADAMRQYEDETPPLCLLQACIINTSYSMTHGVYGKAWRSLGLCIQLAYELNLHLIDFELYPDGLEKDPPDLCQWSQDEEARRAWWTIWEMDSYSSSIRRCPGSLRTSEVQTLLPVSDDAWFQNRHQNSVFLSSNISNLINTMQKLGNESPLCWLIIAIALMRDAQSQSEYKGALWLANKDKYFAFTKETSQKTLDARQTSQTPVEVVNLIKNLQSLKMALPESLKLLNGPLTFTSLQPCSMRHLRQQHSAIYNIAMMIEMARYMAHHFLAIQEVEAGLALHNDQIQTSPINPRLPYPTAGGGGLLGVQSCIDAADNIVDIVSRSSEEQVLYTNSFNINVLALAASVKLVQKTFDSAQMDQDVVQTKVEILRDTMRKSVEVWDAPQALLKNLDFLGERVASGHLFDG